MARVIGCVAVASFVIFTAFNMRSSFATDMPANGTEVSRDGDIPIVLTDVPTSDIPGEWDEDLEVREWVAIRPLRVAHQKNSADRMKAASGFDAVEVDIRGATDDGRDYKLVHDDYHGYTLRQFLSDCRRQGQIAVLDMKHDSDPEGATKVVAEEGMISNTIFQVASGDIARRICKHDGNAMCWLLNGAGSESELRDVELRNYAEYLVGVNICGSVVGTDDAKAIIDTVHSITGRNGSPLDICIFAYGQRTDVYGNDDFYTKLGVDCLMTDVCPERERRALIPID